MNMVLTINLIYWMTPVNSTAYDNITDTALGKFTNYYNDSTITKDAIFEYVYGILHDSKYRERFVNDLAKELPRIPLASEFYPFAEAGRALSGLHLSYGT